MISRLQLWRYRLPLQAPLSLGVETLDVREGLLLEWHGQSPASIVWSEIAPLPGFSRSTLASCEQQILDLLNLAAHWRESLQQEPLDCAEEVRFGIEAGLFQMQQNLSFAGPVASCRLWRHDQTLPELGAANCLKIKVGAKDFATDHARIKTALSALSPGSTLRIDANRCWNLEAGRALAQGLDIRAIDYVEEPLPAGSDYALWWQEIGLPFALDETLRDCSEASLAALLRLPGLKALVIKPMLLGLKRSLQLISAAHEWQKGIVLSAAYESNLTLDFYAALADHLKLAGPHGLDTFDAFTAALIQPIHSQPQHAHKPVMAREQLQCLGSWS